MTKEIVKKEKYEKTKKLYDLMTEQVRDINEKFVVKWDGYRVLATTAEEAIKLLKASKQLRKGEFVNEVKCLGVIDIE